MARASDQDVVDKLLCAADRVVQPYSAAGREMGILVLKPQVAAFLDAASIAGGQDLHFVGTSEELLRLEALVAPREAVAG